MTENELRNYIVNTAKTYLGATEGSKKHLDIVNTYNAIKPLPRGYKLKTTDPWCTGTVSAMAAKCNMLDIIPAECSCLNQLALWQKMGRWMENDAYIPKAGDIIYYDWQDDGKGDNHGVPDHVGIVCGVSNGTITVIEGNKADSVEYRYLAVNGKFIRGYGLPDYASKATKEENEVFTDIGNSAFKEDIEWGEKLGIAKGYADGTFKPNEACTRGQVVTFLWRFAGCPNVVGTKCPFVDVAASSPYYKAILWAVERGITNGVDAKHFKPNDLITRAQFVTFLWRYAGKDTASINNPFADISESSVFFKAILWAVERGITNGVDSKHFMPNANCTRAQTMAFLHRYENKEGK